MNAEKYTKLKTALAANPGGLHRATHTPAGEKIPATKLEASLHSKNKHVRQMANLAKTAKGFHHGK